MRRATLQWLERAALIILLLTLGGGLLLAWEKNNWGERLRQVIQSVLPPQRIAELAGQRIGLVAGHAGNDSGAVCPDGLQEAEVNRAVTLRVTERLRRAGADVDVLAEFDERLTDYQAVALVSIHADSCIAATGFKIARSEFSVIPGVEDRLVACLYQTYGEATGLPRHDGSITVDMTEYHAFRVIRPETPAAIIELGFLGGDRQLLTTGQDRMAYGIAEGIICFLTDRQP